MDLLKDNPRKLFLHYLAASFGGCMIMTVYSLVDTIAIGRYEGPNGAAAVAAVMPMWTIMFSLGLLLGIGGSVLMAQRRGAGDRRSGDRYFTVSAITGIAIAAALMAIFLTCLKPILYLFGGRGEVLELAMRYSIWIARVLPSFTLMQVMSPFIRNDGHPGYATLCTVSGGAFNVFGDIFFVFTCDMGISGAGLATAIGQLISFGLLLAYFFGRKSSLKLCRLPVKEFFSRLRQILTMGASNFIIDVAMGVLAVLFNNQIVALLSSDALAVYGVVSNFATIVQTFGYAIGESAQAVMSPNFGAGNIRRVRTVQRYGLVLAFLVGILGFAVMELVPNLLVRAYMTATEAILVMAPSIMRRYGIAFIPLVANVFSTYYFQAVSRPAVSMAVSLLRGIVLSGLLIFVLPLLFGTQALWFAVPLAECLVLIFAAWQLRRPLPAEKA